MISNDILNGHSRKKGMQRKNILKKLKKKLKKLLTFKNDFGILMKQLAKRRSK